MHQKSRTRREEVLVMLRLVQRMVRMRRKDRGWHQRVTVLQDGHPGGQAAAERWGDDLPQRLGFVQYVVNEKRRGSLRGRRRRVVQTHCVDFDWEPYFPAFTHAAAASALSRDGLRSLMWTLHKWHWAEHFTDISGRARLERVFRSKPERIGCVSLPFSQLEFGYGERGPLGSRVLVTIGAHAFEAGA